MSTDGGTVWSVKDNWFADGGAYTSDPTNSMVYWSGGRHYTGSIYVMSVSKTTDSGTSWTRYDLSSSAGWAYAIAVDPANSSIVYAGGEDNGVGAIYRTANGGTDWFNISTGISGIVYDIAIDRTATNTIYAATADGLYKSTNSGANWSYIGCTDARALQIDPDDASLVYAGTYSGVYRSTNGGGDWSAMNDGLIDRQVNCLGINPNEYLFCGTEGGGIYRWEIQVGVEERNISVSNALRFIACPNPITDHLLITYQLPTRAPVDFSIYDVQGRCVRTLVDEIKAPGIHNASWDGFDCRGKELPPGIYFGKLSAGNDTCVEKLVLIR